MMPPWIGDVLDVVLLLFAAVILSALADQVARLFNLGRYAVRVRRAKRMATKEW